MAVKLSLIALVSLGLVAVAVAVIQIVWSESSASAAIESYALSGPCGNGRVYSEFSQSGHVGWNVASWLIGLGLVVAVQRGRAERAHGEQHFPQSEID